MNIMLGIKLINLMFNRCVHQFGGWFEMMVVVEVVVVVVVMVDVVVLRW